MGHIPGSINISFLLPSLSWAYLFPALNPFSRFNNEGVRILSEGLTQFDSKY